MVVNGFSWVITCLRRVRNGTVTVAHHSDVRRHRMEGRMPEIGVGST